MLTPATYREAYGFETVETLPRFPPLYVMAPPVGRPILAASPYVTNSVYPDDALAQFPEYLDACVAAAESRRARFALLKTDRSELVSAFGPRFHVDLGYSKSRLDLTGGAEHVLTEIIPAKTRNQIKKGQKLDCHERLGRQELLDDFYAVIAKTQTELGTPVHHRRYYAAILNHNPNADLLVLYLDGRPVSAALTLVVGDAICHPYAGTLNRAKPTCVNNRLYWRLVELGIERGCRWFDLGRSIKGSGNERYKRSWGGVETPVCLAYWLAPDETPPSYDSTLTHLATSAWRFLPTAIAKGLGHHFIRYVP